MGAIVLRTDRWSSDRHIRGVIARSGLIRDLRARSEDR